MNVQLPFFLDRIWLIPMFPLITAAAMFFFGRRLKNNVVSMLCAGSVFLSFVFAVGAFFQLLGLPVGERVASKILFDWIPAIPYHTLGRRLANFVAPWGFQLDPLSVTMALFVTGVASLIHLYAIGYMHGDREFPRFFMLMNLFLFSMLCLVLADNFLFSFLGWEGVGFCSYQLVSFWFDRNRAAVAAYRALRVEGLARVDLFLADDGEIVVNEVNTMPGFTPISMFPMLWEAEGRPFLAVVEELVTLARARDTRRRMLRTRRVV